MVVAGFEIVLLHAYNYLDSCCWQTNAIDLICIQTFY